MGLFDRRKGAQSSSRTRREDLDRLRAWSNARRGVEAYVEPITSTSHMTLLLVAGDGESTRTRIGSAGDAADFARKAGIPIYDTNRVGIPQRKRDYDVRLSKNGGVPPTSSSSYAGGRASVAPPASRRSPAQQVAIETLTRLSGSEVVGEPTAEQLQRMLRLARARVHPDRTGGDRTDWDRLEQSARVLDLEL